ncbi:IS21 family transposase [Desulfococcus sp.]|uniref:IS21 family transposase n=1 Tax=Desulfococcus sp. TaxID=2025834 RepID=UPI0035939FC5
MFQYRHIIHCMRMGQSDRAIAAAKLMGRLKCAELRSIADQQGWLGSDPLPDDAELAEVFEKNRDCNATRQSMSLPHEQQIRQWLDQGIHTTTIYRALVEQFGFSGSYSSVRRMSQRLKNGHPKVTCILDFAPAEAGQVDFGKGPTITDVFTGEVIKTWIFVMTLCFSRHMYAEMVVDQKVGTWLACHRRAFEFFGGVPGRLIIDNPKCAITRACFRDPEVQRSYGELAEGYGFLISPCPPRDPKKKGRVEAGVKYVKNSFVPLRSYRSLADANGQLARWVMETAGNRIHGTTHQKPLALFAETEKALLRRLPDMPVETAAWTRLKLHSDCHLRFEKSCYSAPFRLVGQELWVKTADTTVKIYHDLQLVAIHPRLRKPGSRATVDDHLPPEAIAFKTRDPQWCLRQAESVGIDCHRLIHGLLDNGVLDNLRAAQGVIGLTRKYGAMRLENACRRALFFDNVKYRSVKSILEQGLDQTALPDDGDSFPLPSIYTAAGRFIRHADDLQVQSERRPT